MKILLDTCTFLWACSDLDKLSAEAVHLCANSQTELYLSSISVYEILLKHSHRKLHLPTPPQDWLAEKLAQHGILPLSFDVHAALFLTQLPSVHRDPFDRMLICQAATRQLTILTPDPLIRQYPVKTRW